MQDVLKKIVDEANHIIGTEAEGRDYREVAMQDAKAIKELAESAIEAGKSTASADADRLARAVLEWARTPQNHGGNPYRHYFVTLAKLILGARE